VEHAIVAVAAAALAVLIVLPLAFLFWGSVTDCYATLDDGTRVRIQADPAAALQIGERVAVALDMTTATVFTA